MPLPAALSMKRRTRSRSSGREPTRKLPAQRHLERRLAETAQRADALPRALDPAPHGRVEAAAARHLERGEPGLVEHRGDLEDPRGGNPRRERLLREETYRRVDEHGHQTREM